MTQKLQDSIRLPKPFSHQAYIAKIFSDLIFYKLLNWIRRMVAVYSFFKPIYKIMLFLLHEIA